MKFGIIAAGEGSRLKEEGISVLKPMISIGGEMLIERLIRIARENSFESANIIINEESGELKEYLQGGSFGIPVNLIVKSTPSSMHSFLELAPLLSGSSFCLSTTDTVFDEREFRAFIEAASREDGSDGLIAVTGYIDDEKPLYVKVSEDYIITEFADIKNGCRYVTGGVYFFGTEVFRLKIRAEETGISRLRNFLRLTIAEGMLLRAHCFTKIVDVDHEKDIEEADRFIRGIVQ